MVLTAIPELAMTSEAAGQRARSAASTGEWHVLSDELLHGLIHALNNRVAALSAFIELARLGDDEANVLGVLPAEISLLHKVNGMFALLPERKSEAEALELPLVLDDALMLHEHHPRLRGERCVVVREGTPLPVRAPRWALLRVLLMLVHAAKRTGESVQGRGGSPIRVVGEPTTVSIRVESRAEPSASLVDLAARCGGTIVNEDDELVFCLPSILELRRLERAARESNPADLP